MSAGDGSLTECKCGGTGLTYKQGWPDPMKPIVGPCVCMWRKSMLGTDMGEIKRQLQLRESEDQSNRHARRDKSEEWDMREERAHAKQQEQETEQTQFANCDLTKDSGDDFLALLDTIGQEDAAGLKAAQQSYGNSWKSRGGVGAFMMLARKWDRMENRLKVFINNSRAGRRDVSSFDIFGHIAEDQRSEGIIDDVRDLRRYLMLVEAEMRARGFNATHRDNA